MILNYLDLRKKDCVDSYIKLICIIIIYIYIYYNIIWSNNDEYIGTVVQSNRPRFSTVSSTLTQRDLHHWQKWMISVIVVVTTMWMSSFYPFMAGILLINR